MHILVAHRAWVEWIIKKSVLYICVEPRIRGVLLFRILGHAPG